ncbi:hypothetical protein DFO77_11211 [Marinilabilia salmonicolor]|jgi:hypothetical protein|uniref:Uncharacterized protein n=1 Tax=Marinilabilia salmonicolor TaxID=989 RepID=A0A2T0XH89_9BACT|nr:hypothetical protein BY457_11087 [Marinilabilia salmonicolor]RCW33849.1 hypothetical protein DFO77_11211 [Marinilabilia salmonicolor]
MEKLWGLKAAMGLYNREMELNSNCFWWCKTVYLINIREAFL